MAKRLTVAGSKSPGKPVSVYLEDETNEWLNEQAEKLSAQATKTGKKPVSKSSLLNRILRSLRESGTVIDMTP